MLGLAEHERNHHCEHGRGEQREASKVQAPALARRDQPEAAASRASISTMPIGTLTRKTGRQLAPNRSR